MTFDQADYDIKCEWGLQGIEALSPACDVIIIIDVLSFTTCVEIAVSRGALIYPYASDAASLSGYAESLGAILPDGAYTFSQSSLMRLPRGSKLVLPSPNGSTLSLATGDVPTLAGCLRNAQAVANAAMQIGKRIGVIAAGERWRDEHHSLRPSLEDWLGAGAMIEHLRGSRSSEAWAAAAIFRDARRKGIEGLLMECASGRELIEKGRAEDVKLSAMLNTSTCVPLLRDGAYTE